MLTPTEGSGNEAEWLGARSACGGGEVDTSIHSYPWSLPAGGGEAKKRKGRARGPALVQTRAVSSKEPDLMDPIGTWSAAPAKTMR